MSEEMEYTDYIDSDAWRARREAYYQKHPKVCARCGSEKNIQLHHLTYKNLTRELDEDLLLLCKGCHKTVHKHHRRNRFKSLVQATHEVVAHLNDRPVVRREKEPGPPVPSVRPCDLKVLAHHPPGWLCVGGDGTRCQEGDGQIVDNGEGGFEVGGRATRVADQGQG